MTQLTAQQIKALQHILLDMLYGGDTTGNIRVDMLWELVNLGLITLDPITLTEEGISWLLQNGYLW